MQIFANYGYKAELLQLNHTKFIFLRNFINKKVGLVFSISNFFINIIALANTVKSRVLTRPVL